MSQNVHRCSSFFPNAILMSCQFWNTEIHWNPRSSSVLVSPRNHGFRSAFAKAQVKVPWTVLHRALAWCPCLVKLQKMRAVPCQETTFCVTHCHTVFVHIGSYRFMVRLHPILVLSSHNIPLWGIGKKWNKCCKRIPRIAVPSNGNSEGHLGCWRQVPLPKGSNLAVQSNLVRHQNYLILPGFTLACDIPHACSLVRGGYFSRILSSPLLQPAAWQQDHPKSAHVAIWW
jgi:hypothetical protein